jgi:hypothetical protein
MDADILFTTTQFGWGIHLRLSAFICVQFWILLFEMRSSYQSRFITVDPE